MCMTREACLFFSFFLFSFSLFFSFILIIFNFPLSLPASTCSLQLSSSISSFLSPLKFLRRRSVLGAAGRGSSSEGRIFRRRSFPRPELGMTRTRFAPDLPPNAHAEEGSRRTGAPDHKEEERKEGRGREERAGGQSDAADARRTLQGRKKLPCRYGAASAGWFEARRSPDTRLFVYRKKTQQSDQQNALKHSSYRRF